MEASTQEITACEVSQRPLDPMQRPRLRRVLLVDDSNTVRHSMQQMLAEARCEVSLAEDGFDALLHCSIAKPDIVFMDITMPHLDGFQVCSLLMASKRFASTPIVLVSANDNILDRAKAQLVGAKEFIAKPFRKQEVVQALERYVPVMQEGDDGASDGANTCN